MVAWNEISYNGPTNCRQAEILTSPHSGGKLLSMSATREKIFPSRITAWLSVGLAAIILLTAVAPPAAAVVSAGLANAGLHPVDTATGLYNQAQATALNFAQGDAYTCGKYLGYAVTSVAGAVASDGFGDAGELGGGANALMDATDTGAPSEIVAAGDAGANIPEGSFSIRDWTGYPEGAPRPAGPFRFLGGKEYETARDAANAVNKAIHDADSSLAGQHIHEIQPVKFGGSPTNLSNKIPLPPQIHQQFASWWNALMRNIYGG